VSENAEFGRVALATPAAAASISVHGVTERYGDIEACLAVAVVEFSGRE
jgi:hypothetical protein